MTDPDNKQAKLALRKLEGKTFTQVIGWIVTLLVPVVLVLTGVRAMLFPLFLEIEYRLPGFPQDAYGFTLEDRLYWSKIAMDYLLNDASIEFLSDLYFEDDARVYNPRELRHMVDVKIAVQTTLWVWRSSLVLILGLSLWGWFGGWRQTCRKGLQRGGWLTVYLVGGIILAVLLAFGVFFVAFHNVFFEEGTWMFEWSDTLIRLFPERFWRDIFIYVGGIASVGGLALALGLRQQKV